MPILHLLNQAGDEYPQPKEINPGLWESGYWVLSEARAEVLVRSNATVYFHRAKAEPSFLVGRTLDYRRESFPAPRTGRITQRTVLIFERMEAHPVSTERGGWTPAGVKFVS